MKRRKALAGPTFFFFKRKMRPLWGGLRQTWVRCGEATTEPLAQRESPREGSLPGSKAVLCGRRFLDFFKDEDEALRGRRSSEAGTTFFSECALTAKSEVG